MKFERRGIVFDGRRPLGVSCGGRSDRNEKDLCPEKKDQFRLEMAQESASPAPSTV
jgi:hypothetical protein